MSCICLGGVCIPYSAILPLIIVLLQYLARPLSQMGLLPKIIERKLGIAPTGSKSTKEPCCDKSAGGCTADGLKKSKVSKIMHEVEDMTYLKNLLAENEIVFLKFTAEWCKPCKQIQAFFLELATIYCAKDSSIAFATVDVDEQDEIAGQYQIGMMPTFVSIRRSDVLETMSGSEKGKLEAFVKRAITI